MYLPRFPYLKTSFFFALVTTLVGVLYLQPRLVNDQDVNVRFHTSGPHVPSLPKPSQPVVEGYGQSFVGIREEMPLFPGCATTEDYAERKRCTDKKLLAFIYGNLKWPALAQDACVEGMAVISFVVEKDGSITQAKIVRNPGGGTGEEALRAVQLMAERDIRWEPGRWQGKPVRVTYNLPVKFKLE